jgi:hypothetical protein
LSATLQYLTPRNNNKNSIYKNVSLLWLTHLRKVERNKQSFRASPLIILNCLCCLEIAFTLDNILIYVKFVVILCYKLTLITKFLFIC